jgi:hypothetical protein
MIGVTDLATFYHYSRQKLEVLEPALGNARHEGEDPRAVGKPVVWLSDREVDSFDGREGPKKFLHVVEIDEGDPDLFADRSVDQFMEQVAKDLGLALPRWFFFVRSVPVNAVREWDGTKYS